MRRVLLLLISVATVLAPAATVASASTASVQNRVHFKIYSPTYFAGLKPGAFWYEDGSYCPDHTNSVSVVGGQGTIGNSLPGVGIFERAAGTCRTPRQSSTPTPFQTIRIHGLVATVAVSCVNIAKAACNASRVKQFGGLITWNVPAVPHYKATEISISTYNLSYATLIRIAQGMQTGR